MSHGLIEQLPEQGLLFARIDQLQSVQEHPPHGPCLRLVAVTVGDSESPRLDAPDGPGAFLIDLGWRDLSDVALSSPGFLRASLCGCDPFCWDAEGPDRCFVIDYALSSEPTGSYAHALPARGQSVRYLALRGFDCACEMSEPSPAPGSLAFLGHDATGAPMREQLPGQPGQFAAAHSLGKAEALAGVDAVIGQA